MILGAHTQYEEDKQLLGCTEQAISYDANTFMFYTGSNISSIRKPIDKELTLKAHELMKKNNIDINNVVCHAGFLINLANRADEQKWNFSINFLKLEMSRTFELGVTKLVLHPGSAVKHTKEEALQNIIDGLNLAINEDTNVTVLLETMSGKGSECGINIDELTTIINKIKHPNKIGVCLDTCHLNDAGYSIENIDDYLNEFDKKIGLDKIKCVHLNDSKNELESHKDRHENIGLGTIGFNNLSNVAHHPKLKDVPKILETPWIEDYPPYKFEIDMLKTQTFDAFFKEKVIKYYKIP